MKKLVLLNSSITTAEGAYIHSNISQDEAIALVNRSGLDNILSAIEHQSTADIMTELLGVAIPVNRIQFTQEEGQIALVFKLNGRPPEGKSLSREEIEKIGYTWQVLVKFESSPILWGDYSPEELEQPLKILLPQSIGENVAYHKFEVGINNYAEGNKKILATGIVGWDILPHLGIGGPQYVGGWYAEGEAMYYLLNVLGLTRENLLTPEEILNNRKDVYCKIRKKEEKTKNTKEQP